MRNDMRTIGTFALTVAALALATSAPAQVIEYYSTDAVGSVRLVTDQSGAVLERHDYLPFGEECTTGVCASNPGITNGQPLRFTGKERDAQIGLDYFGARYYRTNIGRFTTVDPVATIQTNLVDPQRWNRYAYARNNPLRYVDPDGRRVVYTDPRAEILVQNTSAHDSKVKATLELFDGDDEPDLIISVGDPGKDIDGTPAEASFRPVFRERGGRPEALERGEMIFGSRMVEDRDKESEWTVRHEFGHADLAKRETDEYHRLQGLSQDKRVEHDKRPIEAKANEYAGPRPERRD